MWETREREIKRGLGFLCLESRFYMVCLPQKKKGGGDKKNVSTSPGVLPFLQWSQGVLGVSL